MTVFEGRFIELARTFMLYQSDEVPFWYGFIPSKNGSVVYARLYVYDALYDWLSAHKEHVMMVQKLLDAGKQGEASRELLKVLEDIEDAREALLALAEIDRRRNINATVAVTGGAGSGSIKD